MEKKGQVFLSLLVLTLFFSFVSADLTVSGVTGNEEIKVGSTQIYTVTIKNTGSFQEQALVSVYNYRLKIMETVQLSDIAAGETRSVQLQIIAPEYVGSENLIFFATYNYDSSTKEYGDITSNHNQDQFFKIEVREDSGDGGTGEPAINQDSEGETTQLEPRRWFTYWALIPPIIFIVIFIIYRYYKKRKAKWQTSQTY